MPFTVLDSPRLQLRALRLEQAERLAQLGDDPLIVAFTANMPSPYTPAAAGEFIERSALAMERGENLVFGVHLFAGELIGVINLRPIPRHHSGHLGYWMGAPFRGRGYMTEAVERVMQHGFETLNLQRIHTACLAENLASAKVLENAGLKLEGRSQQAFLKDGVFHDLLQFGAVRDARPGRK